MAVIKVDKDNFDEIVNTDKTVLLDFWAYWCGPCQMLAPIIDEIAEEHPEIVVGKINVDDSPALAQKYGIMSIPTLIVMKDGAPVKTLVGARPKDQVVEFIF